MQAGDLTFRVRIPHKDQLAALGESFNSMTLSVSALIEEQQRKQLQRLENELTIAHEVQQQLFPHTLPKLPGVELRRHLPGGCFNVSGEAITISSAFRPRALPMVLADISGKGFPGSPAHGERSGGALRSEVLRYRNGQPGDHELQINTAEIISHLNRHLFRNSSDERYATCFWGCMTRRLEKAHVHERRAFCPRFTLAATT